MLKGSVQRGQSGIALIEALVAILIFSVGLIALMGLQAISLKHSVHSKYRSEASYLANEIIGQMMADKAGIASYVDGASSPPASRTRWISNIQGSLPNGTGSITSAINATTGAREMTVTVSWRNPDEDESARHRYRAFAQVVHH